MWKSIIIASLACALLASACAHKGVEQQTLVSNTAARKQPEGEHATADLKWADLSDARRGRIAKALEEKYGGRYGGQDVRVASVKPGHSAEGSVLWEDPEQLWLDSEPCAPVGKQRQVLIFDDPYQKGEPSQEKCLGGVAYYVKVKVTKDSKGVSLP